MMEHLLGGWKSPYVAYICGIRSKLGIFTIPPSARLLKQEIGDWFLADINNTICASDLRLLHPMESLTREPYVCEHEYATIVAQFRLGVAGLGNKEPRLGHQRQPYCPLCPVQSINCEQHLVCECPAVQSKRVETGISTFITLCSLKGFVMDTIYRLFVTGLDSNSKLISQSSALERGRSLRDLRACWLDKW